MSQSDSTFQPESSLMTSGSSSNAPRRFGRFAIWLLVALLLIVASFGVWCWYSIHQIPEIGEPFDVRAFRRFSVPADKNAFTLYSQATHKLVELNAIVGNDSTRSTATWASLDQVMQQGWPAANDDLRRWSEANRTALDLWRQGTERPEALPLRPSNVLGEMDFTVEASCKDFVRLALLEAARAMAEGREADAWGWYRACLRCARHFAMHAPMLDRMFGVAFQAMAADAAPKWSSRSDVTAANLRTALGDAVSIQKMMPPLSECLKAEYLVVTDSITALSHQTMFWFWKFNGALARARRTADLMFANWLSQSDRPRFRRTPLYDAKLFLFELDPKAASDEKLVPPAIIVDRCGLRDSHSSNWFLTLAMPSMAGLFEAVDREQARQAALICGLAAQLYFREHAAFPASLDEVVKAGYLKAIPADPFGKGEPIHYRREADPAKGARLWSVWVDGMDQQGNIEVGDRPNSPGDKVVHLAVPRKPSKPTDSIPKK
jgi:hypothetical protein